jgi:three-Cys-motif partner protein
MADTEPQQHLFDVEALPTKERAKLLKTLQTRVWTATKAQFIARYLRYFVYITKHGTYLDAFAGPQDLNKPEAWAANLVLTSKPARLRHFRLFEKSPVGIERLKTLRTAVGAGRDIEIFPGDSNCELPRFLSEHPIAEKEATFCLLDQRTFECDWATVAAVAAHKRHGNKIELFYFLCSGWLERALSGLKRDKNAVMTKWWGRSDWRTFEIAERMERPVIMARRFMSELGYKSANAYPIFKEASDSRIMFFMVHASDHPEAPELMTRAYNNAMEPLEPLTTPNLPWSPEDLASTVAHRAEAAEVKRPRPRTQPTAAGRR